MNLEARVRAALDRNEPVDSADVRALLLELQRVRRESEQRWQAIGRLAPAAKQHRTDSRRRAQVIAALRTHLDEFAMDNTDKVVLVERFTDWRRRAQAILADS